MKRASSVRSVVFLAAAYGYGAYACYLALGPSELPAGYRYLVLLVASLLVLAAHGLRVINQSQIRRLFRNRQVLRSSQAETSMASWEVLFGWLGVTFALIFLYYAAPAERLDAWYPRLFLCLSVLFVATFRRALAFLAMTLPFVATITVLAAWQDFQGGLVGEVSAKTIFLALDAGLLWWAARMSRAAGVFSVNEFEMPLGPGQLGGRLSGFLRTQSTHSPQHGYQLDLTCIRQTRDGKRATGEVLHHERKVVRGDMAGARFNAASIPVEFDIPGDAVPTSATGAERVQWTLRASAELPNSAFNVSFEVPVEVPSEEYSELRDERIDSGLGGAQPEPAARGVLDNGAILFRSGSDWNGAGELLTCAFFVLWCQLVWLASIESLGWPAITMFVAGLVCLAALVWPLGVRILSELREGVLKSVRRELWRVQEDTVAGVLVDEVQVVRSGVRAGLTDAQPCYDVVVKTQAGRRFPVGTQFRERLGAEAFAAEMKSLIDSQNRLEGEKLALELQGV